MKINKYSILFLLVTLFAGAGCNDYLDKAPDERLEVNTLEKAEAALVGAYQNARSYRFTDFSTDNVTLVQNVYSIRPILEDLYTWSRDFANQTHQDSPSSYWVYSYQSIANTNLTLETLKGLSLSGEEAEKAEVLRGEALVMRSYCHFMLVNLFSKHFDPNTANSDLGIPYVTKLENKLEVNYERGTVENVYNLAEKDLLEGIALLEKHVELVNKNKYRFTFPSVYTYASRFYNFRNKDAEDASKTLAFAQKAIAAFGGTEVMRPWNDYKTDDYGPIDIDQSEVGMVQASYTWTAGYNWMYHMTTGIQDDYLAPNPFKKIDERLRISYRMKGDIFVPAFYYVNSNSNSSTATDIFPIAEAILNAAEGALKMGNYDEAKKMLEVIGGNVYRGYDPADLTTDNLKAAYGTDNEQTAWLLYLLHERRNMFLLRGFRWFDIKRYGLDVEHILADGTKIKLSEIAPNKDYQIPNFAISAGMQPNK